MTRTATWVAGLLLLVFLPALFIGRAGPPQFALVAALASIVLGILAASSARSGEGVELVPEGVSVPRLLFGKRTLRAAHVESAYAAPGRVVVLRLADGSAVELTLDEPPARVLEHLGLTLSQRALTAPLRGVLGGFTRGLLSFLVVLPALTFGLLALTRSGWALLAAFVLSLAASIGVARWLRPRVVVGVDGVRIIGVLRPQFIPFDAIRVAMRVPWQGSSAVVLEVDLRSVVLPVVGQSDAEIHALMGRIAEGTRLHREAARARDVRALDRGERSLAEWRASVQRLAVASGGFREAALGLVDLEEIVDDPRARLEHRVGAALALREIGEPARERIRIAGATSADPVVRAALEAAAEEEIDEPALEKVMRAG